MDFSAKIIKKFDLERVNVNATMQEKKAVTRQVVSAVMCSSLSEVVTGEAAKAAAYCDLGYRNFWSEGTCHT